MSNVKSTITLYTVSWSGYWDKYGKKWAEHVNKLNTCPDEIIIVSDVKLDTSFIVNNNVINIVVEPSKTDSSPSYYRNIAIDNSTCDWVVASDLDDLPMAELLDNLDDSADIHAFSFYNNADNIIYCPNQSSLNKRMNNVFDRNLIPGTSAIKRNVFNNVKYEANCNEDHILYKMLSKMNLKVSFDNNNSYRFFYNFFYKDKDTSETQRVDDIYDKVLHKDRNIYLFCFSKEITESEKDCLESIKKECGVNLILIDIKKFYEYEHKEMPIHSAFNSLTDAEKVFYAKAYMMYFYGEGYLSIKENYFDWNKYFDKLFISKHDVISFPCEESLNTEDSLKYDKIYKNNYCVLKPKTKIAHDWLMQVHKMFDKKGS